jgi:hypothetical protein
MMRHRAVAWLLCAWIAWATGVNTAGRLWYTPIGSRETSAACEALASDFQARSQAQTKLGGVTVVCLPDTVDPRAPKQ